MYSQLKICWQPSIALALYNSYSLYMKQYYLIILLRQKDSVSENRLN